MDDIRLLLSLIEGKDTSKAYEALKKLEQLSDESDVLYPYINKFIDMACDEKYVLKVRGFRLLCRQAKWDKLNKINENIEAVLCILDDNKPTAVRQAIDAVQELVIYKKELQGTIKDRLMKIDCSKYKDTMQGLIAKDRHMVLSMME